MKTTSITLAIISLLLLAGGAWWFLAGGDATNKRSTTEQTGTQETRQTDETREDEAELEAVSTITYTDSGFDVSLSSLTVGDTVLVVNGSNETLEFSSDPHPQHTDNSELNLSLLRPGEQETFVISEPGEWGFHNHLNDNHSGVITVTD